MAAPQISSLNTLRSSRGGRTPRLGRPIGAEEERAANDKIVQGTDNDASVSRLSAVEVGYLEDPFAKAFVPSETDRWIRRFPIINRGRLLDFSEVALSRIELNAFGRYIRKVYSHR
jgi:[phosphatase 2A protein]-leucine-carboxy methyltransferase